MKKQPKPQTHASLDRLARELANFVIGAQDVCVLAWNNRGARKLVSAYGHCKRVFGAEAKAMLGIPAGAVFAGGERAVRDLLEQADGDGGACSVLRPLLRVGGPAVAQQFTARLTMRVAAGGSIALLRDLSLSTAESDATLRAADLSRFASLLAHEVRNPLSAVKIALQTLERHGELLPNDLRRAKIAIREVGNIEVLLNEVLEFARPPSLSRVPIDPRGPVREAAEQLSAEWKDRGVKVLLELPDRMSPVQADPTRLRTAARLLVRLGPVAAEEAGGGLVRVSVRDIPASAPAEKGSKRCWELAVRDPGRTLSPEAREQAFVPFHPSRARGSGLALAVVERIAREHGGAVLLSGVSGGNLVAMTMPED